MSKEIEKGHLGETFDSFLEQECIREEVTAAAVKRVIAWQLQQIMTEQAITKSAMARRLKTSRVQLDRLLEPENGSVTLEMLTPAAKAVGRSIKLELA